MILACVAGAWKWWAQEKTGAWKWWAQEKTGAREEDTRGERVPHSWRVSLARARSLFRLQLPSACYAGYNDPTTGNRYHPHSSHKFHINSPRNFSFKLLILFSLIIFFFINSPF